MKHIIVDQLAGNRATAILSAALVAVVATTGCWGDDEGVSSSNAKGGGNNADGTIADATGGIGDAAVGADAGASDASSNDGAGTGGDAGTADAASGPKTCATNKECAADEHCALFYNNVKELTGDADGKGGKKLPGWANTCVKTDKALAALGTTCDPFTADTDKTLKACHNASTCQQGLCTGLCESDADCVKGSICAASEVPIEVTNQGNKAFAFLVAQVCVPVSGSGKDCQADTDCAGGEVCRPHLKKNNAGKLTTQGRCSVIEAGKQKVGGSCGAKSGGAGLGKLCGSALCQYTGNGTVAGICTAMCSQKSDCPATLSYGGVAYKTACSSFFSATNDPTQLADDVFIPQCVLVHEKSSMTDCSAKKACTGTEACLAFAIARGPGQASKVQHFCVEQATKEQPNGPPKKTGEACDPKAATPQCAGGYCIGSGASAYCTKTCIPGGCPTGTKCGQHVLIDRGDSSSATTTLCKK